MISYHYPLINQEQRFALDKLVKNQPFTGGMLIVANLLVLQSLVKVIEVSKLLLGLAQEDTSELLA